MSNDAYGKKPRSSRPAFRQLIATSLPESSNEMIRSTELQEIVAGFVDSDCSSKNGHRLVMLRDKLMRLRVGLAESNRRHEAAASDWLRCERRMMCTGSPGANHCPAHRVHRSDVVARSLQPH